MKVVLDIETVAAPVNEWAALVGLDIVQVELGANRREAAA